MHLYPLLFDPILVPKIWGGDYLHAFKNTDTTLTNIGESWEISAVPGAESVITNGRYKGEKLTDLVAQFPAQILGKRVMDRFGPHFPLLIKLINAAQDLSIQVHPGDEMAQKYHNCPGKSEMWYILKSDPGAKLHLGLRQSCTRGDFAKAIENNQVMSWVQEKEVKEGEAYYIKAGLVHAIGKGITLAEIQQSSDITYRVYDYNRLDSDGQLRPLHIDKSLEAIDYKATLDDALVEPKVMDEQHANLANTDHFVTDLLSLTSQKTIEVQDSFIVLMHVGGDTGEVLAGGQMASLREGETILLPACLDHIKVNVNGKANLLKIYCG